MRVLFITYKHQGLMCQGLMYLSAILKANNFEVHCLDTADYDQADSYVKKISPDLLAYSSATGDYKFYNNLNHKLKKHGIMSVIGGPHATFFSKEFMKQESTSFDGACVGEGELALLDLCNKLRDGLDYLHLKNWIFKAPDSSTIVNQVRPLIDNLDELPFPDFGLYKDAFEYKEVIFFLHRGCLFNCSYCMNRKWHVLYKGLGEVVRVPSPAYCIDLIKCRLSLDSKVERITFLDDIFGADITWLKTFCQLYKKEIALPWDAHLHPTMITEQRLRLMANANCRTIGSAIETGNEQIRKTLLRRHVSNEQIVKASKIVHNHGLSLRLQNMLLLPGETFKTAMETFNLNLRCKPEVATTTKFQPYPGLDITEKAIEMGHLNREDFVDKLPDNFHWMSILKFSNKRELEKINNLHNLFTFGVHFSFLKPIIYLLIRLPNCKLHHHIDNIAWKVITHRDYDDMVRRKCLKLKIFMNFIYNFFLPSNIRATVNMKICPDMSIKKPTARKWLK